VIFWNRSSNRPRSSAISTPPSSSPPPTARQIVGRIVNLAGDGIIINTDMLDANKAHNVNRNLIESITTSKISMMPDGLIRRPAARGDSRSGAYLYSPRRSQSQDVSKVNDGEPSPIRGPG